MLLCFFVFILFACGGEELIVSQPKCEERQIVTAKKLPVIVNLFLHEKKYLEDSFVLNALNSMWREVYVTVILAETMKEANAGLIYISGGCKKPIETGSFMFESWGGLNFIIIDSDCFSRVGYKERFSAAILHALGELFGIEPYPDFCSNGVMSESVGKMEGLMPTHLSAGDKEAFYNRSRFSSGWDYRWKCVEKPVWEKGEYIPADFREAKFWADPVFSAIPIESYLNQYFKMFGRSFVPAEEKDAEFVVKEWGKDYSGCTSIAVTYNSLREIRLKTKHECLKFTPNSEWDASIVVHEVAHLFGVSHVPSWCGVAIMDPYANPGPYFTPTDVKAWQARDPVSSVLD